MMQGKYHVNHHMHTICLIYICLILSMCSAFIRWRPWITTPLYQLSIAIKVKLSFHLLMVLLFHSCISPFVSLLLCNLGFFLLSLSSPSFLFSLRVLKPHLLTNTHFFPSLYFFHSTSSVWISHFSILFPSSKSYSSSAISLFILFSLAQHVRLT